MLDQLTDGQRAVFTNGMVRLLHELGMSGAVTPERLDAAFAALAGRDQPASVQPAPRHLADADGLDASTAFRARMLTGWRTPPAAPLVNASAAPLVPPDPWESALERRRR